LLRGVTFSEAACVEGAKVKNQTAGGYAFKSSKHLCIYFPRARRVDAATAAAYAAGLENMYSRGKSHVPLKPVRFCRTPRARPSPAETGTVALTLGCTNVLRAETTNCYRTALRQKLPPEHVGKKKSC